jgi:hypothetical protein
MDVGPMIRVLGFFLQPLEGSPMYSLRLVPDGIADAKNDR